MNTSSSRVQPDGGWSFCGAQDRPLLCQGDSRVLLSIHGPPRTAPVEGSTAERPDLIPGVATVPGFAPRKLSLVSPGALCHSPRRFSQARFFLPGTAPVTSAPLMVCEVEPVRVGSRDAECSPCLVIVPANEIKRVLHVRTAAEKAAALRLVFGPDRILRLSIPLGRRRTSQRDEQEPLARRPRMAPVARFMAHESHQYMSRCTPARCRGARIVVPVRMLVQDSTDISLSRWLRCGATGDGKNSDQKSSCEAGHTIHTDLHSR